MIITKSAGADLQMVLPRSPIYGKMMAMPLRTDIRVALRIWAKPESKWKPLTTNSSKASLLGTIVGMGPEGKSGCNTPGSMVQSHLGPPQLVSRLFGTLAVGAAVAAAAYAAGRYGNDVPAHQEEYERDSIRTQSTHRPVAEVYPPSEQASQMQLGAGRYDSVSGSTRCTLGGLEYRETNYDQVANQGWNDKESRWERHWDLVEDQETDVKSFVTFMTENGNTSWADTTPRY